MMDFTKFMTVLPEIAKMAPQAQEFMAAWLKFMDRMGEKLTWIESKLETLDNKSSYNILVSDEMSEKLTLLLAESNLTPELHSDVLLMAAADPRNRSDLEINQ